MEERSFVKDPVHIDKHMNSFLDECLTDDKSFMKNRGTGKKKNKNKNRPSSSLFNKKRKSSGNALLTGYKGAKNLRPESAMAVQRSGSKNKMYRPSSAFAAHYTKSKKSKKTYKVPSNKINVKTRNTRNYPNI